MGSFKYKLKEKVGDVNIQRGIKSTVSDVNPETGQISWDIEYIPAFDSVYKEFDDLRKAITQLSQKTNDPVVDNIATKVKSEFNRYRTHIRNTYPEAYKKFQTNEEIEEISVTGGSASSSPGIGAQYATPYAFSKKGQKANSATKLTYKLGYKPAPSIPNRKSKVMDYKKLFEK
mgnify:CR=1 FL=1